MIDYSKFSLMGDVSAPTTGPVKAAQEQSQGITASGQLLRGAATLVATSAIAAWSTYNMDKIKARRVQSEVDHTMAMTRIGRQQDAWRGAVQQQQVRRAQVQESTALQVQAMQTRAKLASEGQDFVGPTFDRMQNMLARDFKQAEFSQREAQQAQQAALWGEIVSRSRVGVGPVVERGTSGVEQVGSFLVDTIRIGRGAFGRD